jgi:hypothetical protein
MAAFTKDDTHRLDWTLLQDGSVTTYYQERYLTDAVQWLRDHDYHIVDKDCSPLDTIPEVLKAIGDALGFPDHFRGNSLDAFDDHLYDLHIPTQGGIAIVLRRYDHIVEIESRQAWLILNILDRRSRFHSLFGLRLITLIQTVNPKLEFDTVGAQTVKWNEKEFFDSQRGL